MIYLVTMILFQKEKIIEAQQPHVHCIIHDTNEYGNSDRSCKKHLFLTHARLCSIENGSCHSDRQTLILLHFI